MNPSSENEILAHLSIEALNPMQIASLETNEKAADVILLSPTGSGKTLAFLLPLVRRLSMERRTLQALILVPSRELALQIEDVFKSMKTGYKITACYGGHDLEIERNSLLHTPAVLVGTPGRIADHLHRKNLDLNPVKVLVLDEFDKALEMGFEEDMAFILSSLPSVKKRILTSATHAVRIPEFTGLRNAVKLNFTTQSIPKIHIHSVVTSEKEKVETLFRLLCKLGNVPVLVFCNHRDAVNRISEHLSYKGIVHNTFHGGLEQRYRESTLVKFRNGSSHLLITTDLTARGLDIPDIPYIVHYQLPPKEDAFIHRNGRTARMQAEGTAIVICTEEQPLPEYLTGLPEQLALAEAYPLPNRPDWETLYISAGKKDKVSKTDVLGFLSKIGQLSKGEVGQIDIKDEWSFAAIRRTKVNHVLTLVQNARIKNMRVKIEVARDVPKTVAE